MITSKNIPLLALACMLLGCNPQQTQQDLTKAAQISGDLASILNLILQDKMQMEGTARDLKKAVCSKDNSSCDTVQQRYSDLRSAHEGYLAAIRASVQLGTDATVQTIVDAERQKAALFVQAAATALGAPRGQLQDLHYDSMLTLPVSLRPHLQSVPKSARMAAVSAFQRQAGWLSWDAL